MKQTEVDVAETLQMLGMDQAFSLTRVMELSERVDKEQKKVGEVTVSYPDLEAFGIEAKHDEEAESKRKPGDTFPIYKDERMGWLFNAVQARVEAQARSKTVKGKVKDGMSIPVCFSDLLEVGQRGGDWLKTKADARKSFAAYLTAIGKPLPVVKLFEGLFDQPNSLLVCEERYATATNVHLTNWIAKLSEDDKARYTKVIAGIQESFDNRAKIADSLL